MPMVPVKTLLESAMEKNYGIGAFCCANLEMVLSVIDAAEMEQSPVIVQFHPNQINAGGLSCMFSMVENSAREAGVPVAVSLDHGQSMKQILQCIQVGFTGIMIDTSHLELDENIASVKQVKQVCQPLDIVTEAALGHLGKGKEQGADDMTVVDQAVQFARETELDLLAPAVGNIHGSAHGEWKGAPQLDFTRIHELSQATGLPLCLHGGSNISAEDLGQAVENGVRKVVIFTDLARAFEKALRDTLSSEQSVTDVLTLMKPARTAMIEVARSKMKALGCSRQAVDWTEVTLEKTRTRNIFVDPKSCGY